MEDNRDDLKVSQGSGHDLCGELPEPSVGATAALAPELDEPILADDYPIYAGYLYVADGRVIASDWHGITARQFKGREDITELRRCDIHGRQKHAALQPEAARG